MILLRLVILFYMVVSSVNASYNYKKIIVASFPTQEHADRALEEIENALYDNENILILQSDHRFDVVSRASGKYFIVTIEPFVDRNVLQEVLDEVRKIKKDAFVNRFVSDVDLFAVHESIPKEPLQEPVTSEPEPVKAPKVTENYVNIMNETKIIDEEQRLLKEAVIEEKKVPEQPVVSVPPVVAPSMAAPSTVTDEAQRVWSKVLGVYERFENNKAVLPLLSGIVLLVLVLFVYMYFYFKGRLRSQEQAYKQLQQLMQQKDEAFAKNIHELRTPIHGIIGMTHLLKESDIAELYMDPINKISKSSDRMLQLINDFLDFSKLEAKKIEIEQIEFDLNDVLESLSDNIGIEANKKGLDFLYRVDNTLPKKYIGDPLRISQILLNLISNAIKFTSEGGIYLKISERERNGTFIMLEFEVEDSGIGLSQDQIESAFALFSQTESSTSRMYGGTGLGLAISKELVELMGGTIECRKAHQGNGACFVFTIKLQIFDPHEQRTYRLPSKSMMFKRVVIIDENAQSTEFLTQKLEYFHYNVVTLASLSEVMTKESNFDLFFLDENHFSEHSVGYLHSIKASYSAKIVLVETLYNKMKNGKISFSFDYKLIKPFSQQRIVDMVVELFSSTVVTPQPSKVQVTLKEQVRQLPPSTIMLAEDNEINQKVILGLLKKTPIEVVVANNGEEAVAKAQAHHNIALIFMDLSMPVMDGYTATREIKQISRYEKVPIVALSANVMSEELEKILRVGMEEYLPKPFDMDAFYKLLLRYLAA